MTTATFSSAAYSPDKLIAGNADLLVSRKVTLISGQNLARGALLGKITASGKYTLSASAAGDGSQVPDGILVEATDASGGDAEALVYFRGDFNQNAMTFGTGHTADSVRDGLRGKGITLIDAEG
ncbi:MAG: head decoration protein [Gammaproteobacteria bacterium]|nr:head decoration protein [Gammaproteobacteria bacterium]